MQQIFTNITCCKNINMQLAASLNLLSMNVKQFWRLNDAAYTIYINVRAAREALRGAPLLPPDSTVPCSSSLYVRR